MSEYEITCAICGKTRTPGYSVGRFTLCQTHSQQLDRYQQLVSELRYLQRMLAPLSRRK